MRVAAAAAELEGRGLQSVYGATLLAYANDSDFALLELEEMPPPWYGAYLNGWAAHAAPPNRTAVIHHPSGDRRRCRLTTTRRKRLTIRMTLRAAAVWCAASTAAGATATGASAATRWARRRAARRARRSLTAMDASSARCTAADDGRARRRATISSARWRRRTPIPTPPDGRPRRRGRAPPQPARCARPRVRRSRGVGRRAAGAPAAPAAPPATVHLEAAGAPSPVTSLILATGPGLASR